MWWIDVYQSQGIFLVLPRNPGDGVAFPKTQERDAYIG